MPRTISPEQLEKMQAAAKAAREARKAAEEADPSLREKRLAEARKKKTSTAEDKPIAAAAEPKKRNNGWDKLSDEEKKIRINRMRIGRLRKKIANGTATEDEIAEVEKTN